MSAKTSSSDHSANNRVDSRFLRSETSRQIPIDAVITGDCLVELPKLPDNSIDCIFADPPYNLQLNGNLYRPDSSQVAAVTDDWDKFDSFADYDRFTANWLTQCKRVLKPNGTLWVIGSYHNIFRVGVVLQDLGFWILNDVIWRKSNPMPNFRGKRFTNAHETLIWASPKARGYTFNYDALKALNDGLQMRSDWLFPICSGNERLRDDQGNKIHSTQKPESLLYRIIMASTKPGDIILDPFFGTGTTGAVAKQTARRFIGIEREPRYVNAALKRISKIKAGTGEVFSPKLGRSQQKRIPFGMLIEQGMIEPGVTLTDARGNNPAQVCADGELHSDKGRGSIHQTGAKIQNSQSCNGWIFWHIKINGKLTPIDTIRDRARLKMLA